MFPLVAKKRKLDSTPAKSEKSVGNSENEVRLCLLWKEKYSNLLKYMVLCIYFVMAKRTLMCHSFVGKIFCVLETEIQLVGKNKQHYICIYCILL